MNKLISGAVTLCVVMGLAGCGSSNDGPSSHVVKKQVASKLTNDIDRLAYIGLHDTHPDRLKRIEDDKSHMQHRLESYMHFKGCTKSSDSVYNCSVMMEKEHPYHKTTYLATMTKAGSTWTLSALKPIS